jgi:hypothetical protein
MEVTSGEEAGTALVEITPDPLSDDFLSWVKLTTTTRPGTWPDSRQSPEVNLKSMHQKANLQLLTSYAEEEQRALRLETSRRKKLVQSFDRAIEQSLEDEEQCKQKVRHFVRLKHLGADSVPIVSVYPRVLLIPKCNRFSLSAC